MLSDNQINQYKNDGFVIPDFIMPEETLLKIEKRHNSLLEKHPEFKNYCPAEEYHQKYLEKIRNLRESNLKVCI